MDELASFPSLRLPVTITCDGLRRKELNAIEKPRGPNAGPGMVGTAIWKGVPLAYVLKKCGVKEGAKYVLLEGADQCPKGTYGTRRRRNLRKHCWIDPTMLIHS